MAIIHNEENLDLLYRTFASFEDPADVEALLVDLCTTREVEEMAQRLAVAKMLAKGMPYTRIQEETGASTATIARVAKFQKQGAGGYRKALAYFEE